MSTKNPFASAKKAQEESGQPIGEVVIKLGDLTIAARSIWSESKSRNMAYNDMNDMARDNPEQFIKVLEQYRDKLTFEVRTNEPSGVSFEAFLATL